ncbi:MAG: alpha-amylase family glycosyl hydrolase [Desulfomonilaceae bacterium]|nr:alpha-amylase family glycosyl hydrolase [Desulfomonilaceae bacterium]
MTAQSDESGPSGGRTRHYLKPTDYLNEPDYDLPRLEIPERMHRRILFKLEVLYGMQRARETMPELERLMKVFYAHKPQKLREWDKEFIPEERFSEKDVILITYGDLVTNAHRRPLQTLTYLADRFLKETINTVHILPFFPYSSDRGFSVMDFESVDPHLGTWDDIVELSREFRLMFDGVINHVSSKSRWFQEFLNGNPEYSDFFIKFSTNEAIPDHLLALILRPRTSELLTPFKAIDGEKYVWTTFSPDQVDLNYRSEKVLLKMIDIFLFYIRKGADIIRMDAISYLWEEVGTRCVHLSQTHTIVQLFRDVLDCVAPHAAIITETNVPHSENIEYFGNGRNEAQMVYNFTLPPLVLHTFYSQDASKLMDWAATLEKVSDTATYLNFLDSHDGIGVLPVQDLLTPEAIDEMCWRIMEHGGFISYRADGEGGERPYELNSTWFSALNDPNASESRALQVDRFIASRSIALALRGVPAVYLHGLLGSRNDTQEVLITRSLRSINRHNIEEADLLKQLENPDSHVYRISERMAVMIRARIGNRAFHPNGDQTVVRLSGSVFALMRVSPDASDKVLCLTNVTDREIPLSIPADTRTESAGAWKDIITQRTLAVHAGDLHVTMKPYEVLWLTPLQETGEHNAGSDRG